MEKSKRHFEPNSKYFTISIYTVITVVICAIFIKAIFHISSTVSFMKDFLHGMAPFLIGVLIAYCVNPFYNWLYHKALKKICKGKFAKTRKYISIVLSYMLFLGVIAALLTYIIPNILKSIQDLIPNIEEFYSEGLDKLESIAKKYPELDLAYIENSFQSAFPSAIKILTKSITNIGGKIYGTSISIASWIYNIFIGFVVSFYLILDKRSMVRSLKRLIFALFPEPQAKKITALLRESNDIFSEFIIGKFIDSLIIGIICFIASSLLGINYALIISILVGVTNMIPYVGPFIGGVLGGLLLLVVAPKSLITFIILVFILQQFDGLILGPKILGDKTGLRPFWILFAVTIGGWAGGIIGMFLGVPIIAVIANLVDKLVSKQLAEKNLDIPKISPKN